MWITRDLNRERTCSCASTLREQAVTKPLTCNSCGRTWTSEKVNWWMARDAHKNGPAWSVELVEAEAFGKPCRKYLATNADTKKGVLLASVSNVLEDTLGAGAPLIDWAVREGLLDVLSSYVSDRATVETHLRPLLEQYKMRQDCFESVVAGLPANLLQDPRLDIVAMGQLLDRAQRARYRTAELAAEYGTRAHELIELWVRNGGTFEHLGQDGCLYTIDLDQEPVPVQNAMEAFFKFWRDQQLTLVGAELMLADVEAGIGGTLDAAVLGPNEELILLDWKTSKAVRDKYLLQVGAYARMHERAGLGRFSRAYIVRFDKVTAEVQIVPVFSDSDEYIALARQWGASVNTFRWLKSATKYLKGYDRQAS